MSARYQYIQRVCWNCSQQENWIPGIGMVLGAFLEMLMYCMVGTKSAVVVSVDISLLKEPNIKYHCHYGFPGTMVQVT